jgi:hypothetical protein
LCGFKVANGRCSFESAQVFKENMTLLLLCCNSKVALAPDPWFVNLHVFHALYRCLQSAPSSMPWVWVVPRLLCHVYSRMQTTSADACIYLPPPKCDSLRSHSFDQKCPLRSKTHRFALYSYSQHVGMVCTFCEVDFLGGWLWLWGRGTLDTWYCRWCCPVSRWLSR